jgi:calcium permeable stress-gated cation channel
LSNLGKVWPSFQKELERNPKLWAIVQGVLSPAITTLVYYYLPAIFRALSIKSGDRTKTSRERHVTNRLYTFFMLNNLILFSVFGTLFQFGADIYHATREKKGAWDALEDARFFSHIMISLSNLSPYWLSWLLQRNLGAAIDLSQVVNIFKSWFLTKFRSPTPRQRVEWTAPPPFDYASYYNYFLFYTAVALSFATLQPLVLPVTAIYFCIDSFLKKYLIM